MSGSVVGARQHHPTLLHRRVAFLVSQIVVDRRREPQQLDLQLRLSGKLFLDSRGSNIEQFPGRLLWKLDELSHSILIRTPGGISFQMRSYGEYLAAEELHVMELRKLLRDYTPGAENSLGVMHT